MTITTGENLCNGNFSMPEGSYASAVTGAHRPPEFTMHPTIPIDFYLI